MNPKNKTGLPVVAMDYESSKQLQHQAAMTADLDLIRNLEQVAVESKKSAFNSVVSVLNCWREQGEALRRIMGCDSLSPDRLVRIQNELPMEWGDNKVTHAKARIAISKALPGQVQSWEQVPLDKQKEVLKQMDFMTCMMGHGASLGGGDSVDPFTRFINSMTTLKQEVLKIARNPQFGDIENWTPENKRTFLADTQWVEDARKLCLQ